MRVAESELKLSEAVLKEIRNVPINLLATALVAKPTPTIRMYGPFGNVFFRAMEFHGIGSRVDGHTHTYDHVTYLVTGSVSLMAWDVGEDGQITGDPETGVFEAPAQILIKARRAHSFVALTEHVRADCIFAVRDPETGQVLNEWDGSLLPYV